MEKTITLSDKAFKVLENVIYNEFTDRAFDIACENFDTPEEAEENIRAHAEIFKTFGYDDSMYKEAVILKMPFYISNTEVDFQYFAEWKRYYENYDDESIELVKEITL